MKFFSLNYKKCRWYKKYKESWWYKERERGIGFFGIAFALLAIGLIGNAVAPALGTFIGEIAEEGVRIGLAVAGLMIALPGLIASYIFNLAIDMAGWMMAASVNIPITDSEGFAYKYGWTFTRDLVYMVFIIILAFIGLATILRIEAYKASKTLPKLIIIALLINFSPVILGLIVDFFNILTNFFIVSMEWTKTFLEPQKYLVGQVIVLLNNMVSVFSEMSLPEYVGHVFTVATLAVYFILGAFIMLMIGLLFLFRTIAFWILLILAPIAFAGYILPITKGWWDTWWKQVLQWGMIGLSAAFFLYLSMHLLVAATGLFHVEEYRNLLAEGATGQIGDIPQFFTEALLYIFPFAVALVFMGLGIVVGLATGAMGANVVMSYAKRGGRWAGRKATREGWVAARERVPEKVRKAGEKMARARTPLALSQKEAAKAWYKKVISPTIWAKRAGGLAAAPIYAGVRAAGRAVGPGIEEGRKGEIKRTEEEAGKIKEPNLLLSRVREQLAPGGSIDKAIGLVAGGTKKGKEFKGLLEKELKPAEIERLASEANKIGVKDEAERIARLSLKEEEISGLSDDQLEAKFKRMGFKGYGELDSKERSEWDEKGYKRNIDKIIGEAEKDDIKDFSKGFWSSDVATKAIQRFWGGPQLGKAGDEFGRRFVENYMEGAEEKGRSWYAENNPRAFSYLAGNAAQDLGFRSLGGLSQAGVRERVEGFRDWDRQGRPGTLQEFWEEWWHKRHPRKGEEETEEEEGEEEEGAGGEY